MLSFFLKGRFLFRFLGHEWRIRLGSFHLVETASRMEIVEVNIAAGICFNDGCKMLTDIFGTG